MSAPTGSKRGDYAEHWSHIKPRYLIHAAADYIVFIDDELDVDWETSPEYDGAGQKSPPKHHGILNDAALLETTPCHGLGEDTKLHFKRLIGEAITRSFEHDYPSASKMLDAARDYVLARSLETSRLWYLSVAFAVTALFIVAGLILWLCRDAVYGTLGVGFLWISLSATAGAMGALLSVIARTGKLKFDCSAGKRLHYVEGASRICAGALSGMVVAVAILTEMFLAPLARGDKVHAVMMVAALAAGAVERLATSIISTVGAGNARIPVNKSITSGDSDERD